MVRIQIIDEAMMLAISKGKNVFEENTSYIYLGYQINITRRTEPFKFTNGAGNVRTKSRRYWGEVLTNNGTRIKLEKGNGDGFRGGEIARLCGLYVEKEKAAMEKLGNLYEVTNRRKNEI